MLKKSSIFVALTVISLMFAWFALHADNAVDDQFSEKVNLAIRRTAHLLLLESGDSTARIAPVQNQGNGRFMLRLERPFNYGHLPALLQESLNLNDIQGKYDVALLDCTTGDLQLGYNAHDLLANASVACSGRDQDSNCYDLLVTFDTPQVKPTQYMVWLTGVALLIGVFFYGQWYSLKKNKPVGEPNPAPTEESPRLHFGASSLDIANQLLFIGSVRHPLTYRETKLLQLFVSHFNQLLERDFILQAVWEDEGIIVGRSVDVFVSRLRKMLKEDPSVRIVTQHGVGYRLEANVAVA